MRWPSRLYGPAFQVTLTRHVTSNEVTNAMRPFFFLTHPDLFGNFPEHSKINENAMKTLTQHLNDIAEDNNANRNAGKTLVFYARNSTKGVIKSEEEIRKVIITLDKTARQTVLSALKSVKLPTDYIDKIPKKQKNTKMIDMMRDEVVSELDLIRRYDEYFMKKTRVHDRPNPPNNDPETPLVVWLAENVDKARKNVKKVEPDLLRIVKINNDLRWNHGVEEVIFGTDRRPDIKLMGLRKLQRILRRQPHCAGAAVRGRSVFVHPARSGVTTEGEIVLYMHDVHNSWLASLQRIHEGGFDKYVEEKPILEAKLIEALNGIRLTRRENQPPVLIDDYNDRLKQLLAEIARNGENKPENFLEDTSHLELVLEAPGGEMFLSPSGQFIVPSDAMAQHLYAMLAKKSAEAVKRLAEYNEAKSIEAELTTATIQALGLISLERNDGVGSVRMVQCCSRLLEAAPIIRHLTHGIQMNIDTHYCCKNEGYLNIPWNFQLSGV